MNLHATKVGHPLPPLNSHNPKVFHPMPLRSVCECESEEDVPAVLVLLCFASGNFPHWPLPLNQTFLPFLPPFHLYFQNNAIWCSLSVYEGGSRTRPIKWFYIFLLLSTNRAREWPSSASEFPVREAVAGRGGRPPLSPQGRVIRQE